MAESDRQNDMQLQQILQKKFEEMEIDVKQKMAQKESEIEERIAACYSEQLIENLDRKQEEYNAQLQALKSKINHREAANEMLMEKLVSNSEQFLKLEAVIRDKKAQIEFLECTKTHLVAKHQKNLQQHDENHQRILEQKRLEYEAEISAMELKVESILDGEFKRRETSYLHLVDVMRQRLEEKSVQLNALLTSIRRSNHLQHDLSIKAQCILQQTIQPMLELLRKMSAIHDERVVLRKQLVSDRNAISSSDTAQGPDVHATIQHHEQCLHRLQTEHESLESDFNRKLYAIDKLDRELRAVNPQTMKRFREMLTGALEIQQPNDMTLFHGILNTSDQTESDVEGQLGNEIAVLIEEVAQLFELHHEQ